MPSQKMPAAYKGLNKEETVELSIAREKDVKKKAMAQLGSLVETHKKNKTLMSVGIIAGSAAMEGASHASEKFAKYDPIVGGVVGLAGLGAAAMAEDEALATAGMVGATVGFTRLTNWMTRLGVDKVKEMRAKKAA